MDERRAESRWVALAPVGLIALLSMAALVAPRFEHPAVGAHVTPAAPSLLPVVEPWLSTADRRLKMARQPGVAMRARGTESADITIDVQSTYQSMVGFG